MQIQKVETKADLRRFLNFPYRHYRDDPVWVPPLRAEQRGLYKPRSNPMLNHCEYDLFLLMDGREVLGRVTAFFDHLAIKNWGAPIGLFGAYECIDDPAASRLLLDTAADWLKSRGMAAMRGPWSFASQEWGAVLEGFEPPPVILAPYNPPYYNDQFVAYGLEKVKDLLVYYIDIDEGYEFPERFLTITDAVQERYGVTIRAIDMGDFEVEVQRIIDVINSSLIHNWGYYEVTEAEADQVAADLKMLVRPDIVLIADDPDGNPIGFIIPLPDINLLLRGLNGRLLPFALPRLLFGVSKLRQYRLWALGVVPEYQGKAVDALMYRRLYEVLYDKGLRIEINYVLEDNYNMINALKRLGVKPLRRYRVYEMPI